ncbi:hypothetical protein Tco_1156468 [Tanacetum coccineum]
MPGIAPCAMSKYHFISGSNINRPELAVEDTSSFFKVGGYSVDSLEHLHLLVFTSKSRVSRSNAHVLPLIAQCVDEALDAYEANHNSGNGNGNGNGNDNENGSHDLGSGSRRTLHISRGCTYKEFLNCRPLNFNVKYATCTLPKGALTLWNSYVRTVGHDAAY